MLEDELSNHQGDYLFDDLSLADLVLVPTVVRLQAHSPDFAKWPRTENWFKSMLARESVCEWMDEARDLPPIWLDDYIPEDTCQTPGITQ